MDMIAAMNIWDKMGGEFNSIDEGKDGAYITQFIWDGEVEGHVKAVAGGMYWNWPQRLLDVAKAKKEIFEKYYLNKYSWFLRYSIGTNGVDCWFEDSDVSQHRCLSFDEFKSIECIANKN